MEVGDFFQDCPMGKSHVYYKGCLQKVRFTNGNDGIIRILTDTGDVLVHTTKDALTYGKGTIYHE